MTDWQIHTFLVLVQVTAITLLAAGLMAVLRRRAIHRHTVGLIALALVVTSPILVGVMPRVDWFSHTVEEATPAPESAEPRPTTEVRINAPIVPGTPAVETPASLPDESRDTPNTLSLPSSTVLAPKPEWNHRSQTPVSADVPSVKPPVAPLAATPEQSRFDIIARLVWSVCVGIWGLGAFAFFLRLLWRERRIRHVRRSLRSIPTSDALGTAARAACERVGLATAPPMFASAILPAPVVLGVWRPAVVLPLDVAQSASSNRLADILTHEFAHIVRRDPWIHVLQKFVGVAYWFHPGVRWLNSEITRSREEVCDNYVLRQSEPADYAQTLLDLATRRHDPSPALSLLGLFRRESLEARVTDILRPNRETALTPDWKIAVAAAAFLLSMCALIGGARASDGTPVEATQPDVAESPRTEKQSPAEHANADDASETAATEGDYRTITIRGICYDADKEPLAGVHVRLFRGPSPFEPSHDPPVQITEVKTDDDGRYEFTKVKTIVDRETASGLTDLIVAATKPRHASVIRRTDLKLPLDVKELDLTLKDDVATLSGTVRDVYGRPISEATVFTQGSINPPLPGIRSATTDAKGHYAITDFAEWNPNESTASGPDSGVITEITFAYLHVIHPNHAKTRASYSAIPQEVDIVLHPPAIIEGQVIDLVTGKPLPHVTVSVQGVVDGGWAQTHTDQDGHYQLRLTEDHYNIWAEADKRMPLAVKALEAIPGERARADIRMARGGFITGRLIDDATGQPMKAPDDRPIRIAHYGPARPRTGAAVTSTTVGEDGRYRLHVAPGRNYIYVMTPPTKASAWVTVGEGEEVQFDLRTGDKATGPAPDLELAGRLRQEAREQEALEKDQADPSRARPANPPEPPRLDTPTGRLLDRLEELNTNDEMRFSETWAKTIHDLIWGGSDAVPELVAELDRTESDMMVSCLAFILRGIDDQRAVPALIRAIPKTLAPSRSDMGLRVEDPDLMAFMRQHDLDEEDRSDHYGFGRSVREVFGALRSLTGQRFNEQELLMTHRMETVRQVQLQEALFHRTARRWSDWWEANWSKHVDDGAYSQVNLPPLKSSPADTTVRMETKVKPVGQMSGAILESVHAPDARRVFYDLDTGRRAPLPDRWRGVENNKLPIKDITAWAEKEGFDLMGDEYVDADGKHVHAIRSLGLQAWELDKGRLYKESSRFQLADLKEDGRPAGEWLLPTDNESGEIEPTATETFLFITREGSAGLIEIGVDVQDDSQQPGGPSRADANLDPVGFRKGRRFGTTMLIPMGGG